MYLETKLADKFKT